ncbi:MAG: mechanosensitive ion channel [Sedimentisphaerales bacterium]|nr:mechanosensitive ion channel [Sedimentisphaerales bacterium]
MRLYKECVLAVIGVVVLFSIPAPAQNGIVNGSAPSAADAVADAVPKTDYGLPWALDNLPEIRKQVADMDIADKEAKTKLLDIYDKAIAQWKLLQAAKEETTGFSNRFKNIPTDLARIKEQLSQAVDDVFPENAGTMLLADVQKEATGAQALYEEAKKKSTDLENELKRRAERRVSIPVESAGAREQLAQMKEKLPAAAAEVSVADAVFAGRVLQVAQIVALEAKIESLGEELKLYDAAGDLLTARRELASRNLVLAEKRQKFWQEQLVVAQKLETEKLKEKAKETVKQTKYAHPVIQKLAQENAELVNIQADLIRQMEQANQYSKKIEDDLAELEAEFTALKKEIGAAGEITNVMGVLLLSKREELQDTGRNREQIKARLAKISTAKLNWSKYDEQWSDLADVEAVAKLRLREEQLTEQDAGFDEAFKDAVKLLEDHRNSLRKISDYYEDLSTVLARLDVRERKFVSTAAEYKVFIDENILWIRSSTSISLADFGAIGKAIRWFISPGQWIDIWRYLWSEFRSHTAVYILIIVLVALLWLYRLNMTNRLEHLVQLSGHMYSDKYSFTIKALVLSIIAIVPLPLLTGFISWRLLQSPPDLTYVHIVGSGLKSVTVLMVLFMAFIGFCRRNGLSDHFNLPRASMNVFARYLRLTLLILIPIVFARRVFCDSAVEDVYRTSLGRIGFVAEMIAVSLFFVVSFRPSGAAISPLLTESRGGWLYRMRYAWYGALVFLPLLFAVLHLSGYDYTAGQLYYKFIATALLVFAIMFCKGMLTRWLTLMQMWLVLRQKAKSQAEKAARTDSQLDNQERSQVQSESEEDHEQLVVNISQQTLSLVQSVAVLAVFLGIWLIWKNVLPALSALENIGVWNTTDAQGATVIISLGNIFKAVLIFVMTVVAARNAPGLMEVLVLQRLPLDQGVRFAVTSLSRYAFAIIGVVMTFGQIGIGWAKVQWLIAAMTVGLGFGLQEIFANFISGLIILFEQPIRVGDAVTVGDVNGTVTKIKIRATTIRKWDQKELIVPNREFITGRVLNWSLSDRTLRMEFPVGVAYGSDIKKTEETLYRVARNQEGVIHDDPAPRVIFRSFGESSLDFELRVYIPHMDNYLTIWHEINCAIDSEFRKEGIEIAFPQRDLHIRSVEAIFPVQQASRQASSEESQK